jgi:hypothetical protein
MAKVGVGVSEKELRGGREGREGVLIVIKTKTSRQDMRNEEEDKLRASPKHSPAFRHPVRGVGVGGGGGDR